AAGECRRLLARLATQHREAVHCRFDARPEIETAGRCDAPELEIGQNRQFRKDVAALWNVTDAGADELARRMVGHIPAVIEYSSVTDRQHPKRGLERGPLARADL